MATLTLTRLRELIRARKEHETGAEEVLQRLLLDERESLQALLGRELVPGPDDPGALAVLEVRLNRAVRGRLDQGRRRARGTADKLARRVVEGTRVILTHHVLPVGPLTELVAVGGFQDLVFARNGGRAVLSRRVLHSILRELRGVATETVYVGDGLLHIIYRTRSSRGHFKLKLRTNVRLREHVIVDLDLVVPGAPGMAPLDPVDRVRPTLTPALDRRSA